MFSAHRLLSPIVAVRQDEAKALLLMFLYSFSVMTSYNIIKPLTRAQFIQELGAGNLPWVLLASGVSLSVVSCSSTPRVSRVCRPNQS
jgi:ATP/ADP translocase